MTNRFEDFSIGDRIVFHRQFTMDDFAAFAKLSGDRNALHHNNVHAAAAGFGNPIVPLHLTAAPLSMVAGMVFPGEPSLYLRHEVRALHPVFYGDTLAYSARIESIQDAQRTLVLRVIAIRGSLVVLDAHMDVRCTADVWQMDSGFEIICGAARACAVITGATGAIGSATALALGIRGWRLLLQDRGDDIRRNRLRSVMERKGIMAEFIAADLTTEAGRQSLAAAAGRRADVEALVCCASPRTDASLEALIDVNYRALQLVSNAVFPVMLARQRGSVVLIGSTAMNYSIAEMEDYAAAKTMATTVVSRIERNGAAYGVRGFTLMPGFVATEFSSGLRGDIAALTPEEVAEATVELIENTPAHNALVIEVGRQTPGGFGFYRVAAHTMGVPKIDYTDQRESVNLSEELGKSRLDEVASEVVTRELRPFVVENLNDAGLGLTPGWDSFKQIEIVLALESALGVKFSSEELVQITRFDKLADACRRKARAKP